MIKTRINLIKETWYNGFKWKPRLEKSFDKDVSIDINFELLKNSISEKLNEHKFKKTAISFSHKIVSKIHIWTKKNFNINRAVVLIEIEENIGFFDLVNFIYEIKYPLGKKIGFIPFLYELGIQIIVLGKNIHPEESKNPVDTINNFKVLVQSLFVIDKQNHNYYKSITWGQTISAKFQEAIDFSIKKHISLVQE